MPLTTLTSKSLSLLFSPITCPLYILVPGEIKNLPLSCNFPIENAVELPDSIEISEPFILSGISPLNGAYSLNLCVIIAFPEVVVKILFLNPINPLEGISNSKCCKSPFGSITSMSPFLWVTSSITFPEKSAGTSITNVSIGSHFTPSMSLKITWGLPTCNSKPSLLMVSISTDKWRIPLPNTLNLSSEAPSSTLRARFFSSSAYNLSLKCLEVQYLPSFPKKGELFIVNNILIVGSSIEILGNSSGFSRSEIVSPISKSSKPTIEQISPDFKYFTCDFPIPSKTYNSLILTFFFTPFALQSI